MSASITPAPVLQFLRFALVGGTTAAVYALGYSGLRAGLGAAPIPAAIASYLTAIAFQYVGHAYFTFGGADRRPGEVPRFLAMNGFGLALSSTVSWAFAAARLPDWAASLVVVGGLPILNWFVLRRWVFR